MKYFVYNIFSKNTYDEKIVNTIEEAETLVEELEKKWFQNDFANKKSFENYESGWTYEEIN
jgi:SNF2 family DNA or RNA helicase